jgi:hypothetical protein
MLCSDLESSICYRLADWFTRRHDELACKPRVKFKGSREKRTVKGRGLLDGVCWKGSTGRGLLEGVCFQWLAGRRGLNREPFNLLAGGSARR